VCGVATFNDKSNKMHHVRNHTEKKEKPPFFHSFYQQQYQQQQQVEKIKTLYHSNRMYEKSEQPYICLFCKQQFVNKYSMECHIHSIHSSSSSLPPSTPFVFSFPVYPIFPSYFSADTQDFLSSSLSDSSFYDETFSSGYYPNLISPVPPYPFLSPFVPPSFPLSSLPTPF
jgi:hypothetical protein